MEYPIYLCMPISEIADKYTILHLKVNRLQHHNDTVELFGIYQMALECALSEKSSEIKQEVRALIIELYNANRTTWDLESDIRQCKIDKNIKEIGERTIKIRESNKNRTRIKNKIAKIFGHVHGFDRKGNHASE